MGASHLRRVVAALAIVAALVAIEAYLRATRRIEELYDRLTTYPSLAGAGWQRVYLRDYEALRGRGEIGADLTGLVHDVELGWDLPGRVRAADESSPVVPGARPRVVVLGDSFAYGAEVAASEAFPAQLEAALPGTEVLNLGVRAYSVGQAAFKYWLHGRRYEPDVVVLAIFGLDYYRTPLAFYRAAKPRFDMAADRRHAEILGLPVPDPATSYERIRARKWPLWFTYAFLRQELLTSPAWQEWTHADELFFYRQDEVHEALLRATQDLARADGARLLIVYVPHPYEFDAPQPRRNQSVERDHLTRMSARIGVDWIDLVPEMLDRHPAKDVLERLFLWKDGVPGQLSAEGHRAVAAILAEEIAARGLLPGGADACGPVPDQAPWVTGLAFQK
jgi:lysophospholipase L1-like esterase